MKIKLTLINVSLIVFIAALLATLGFGTEVGASMVLLAAVIMLSVFVIQIIQSIRQNRMWSLDNLLNAGAIFVTAIIFIHGFSVSIDIPFLGNIPGFNIVFLLSGILLICLFFVFSYRSLKQLDENIRSRSYLIVVLTLCSVVSILGLLGISGMIPLSGWLVSYSLMVLLVFYLLFFINMLVAGNKEMKKENWISAILGAAMILFFSIKIMFPQLIPQGISNAIFTFGFIPVIVLPLSIVFIKRFHFLTAVIFYFIFLDIYFIHTNRNFNYLVNVGTGGCIGYEKATEYPINTEPGIPIEELLKEPTKNELDDILTEWRKKDFTPKNIHIEYVAKRANGDSIKVVSHLINGQKHYGLIRIPNGIHISEAPVLIGLMGGGTGMDVLKATDIDRLSSGHCRHVLADFISIMPSFRGNILRGDGYCFRSEGYTGDVWLGAAEDAVAFLEVVKTMYSIPNARVLAKGTSRGATVALIIGGLTDKLDYIIATSTHTKFLDWNVMENERVGGSFSRAFYTPNAPPVEIRKRMMASSPYYFAQHLPPFEIHQGTEDQRTTVWHAGIMKDRLSEIGREDNTYHIYIYEDRGHAYDDHDIVCTSLSSFVENSSVHEPSITAINPK